MEEEEEEEEEEKNKKKKTISQSYLVVQDSSGVASLLSRPSFLPIGACRNASL